MVLLPVGHPWLLLQAAMFVLCWFYMPLFLRDPHGIVTGNTVVVFGMLKKATL